MKTQFKAWLLFILLPLFCLGNNASPAFSINSPDGSIRAEFLLLNKAPFYRIHKDNKIVIDFSLLGFNLKNAAPLVTNFQIIDMHERQVRNEWEPVWGIRDRMVDAYNELSITLMELKGQRREMEITFRVFDDGVGFRYGFPEQPNLDYFEIASEETQFNFTGDHNSWWIPQNFEWYEYLYNNTPLSEIPSANTPITMKADSSLYICIHEADLTDYAGMTLVRNKNRDLGFKIDLTPWPDGVKVKARTPFQTPWRTVLIGETAGELIESNLILNLNDPCEIEDTSWITPMKYVGIWWGIHLDKYTWHQGERHGATTENAKAYIRFAGEHGIPGLLVEGWNEGWGGEDWSYTTPYSDFDIDEVVRYGREHGVSLIGHHETFGDVERYLQQMPAAFDWYAEHGVHTVKTGYVAEKGVWTPEGKQHHHGQYMINHYQQVVKWAAERKIMLDVHEPICPTGLERTWPNLMTQEGVRGTEHNVWSDGNPPEHTTIVPFTRMLAGPLDYTPGIFGLQFEKTRTGDNVPSTLAKQLALFVIMFSPLQMAADLPENYKDQPAFEFIEQVPVTWENTQVLNGEIGDYVTIARRSGSQWFIGSITDENAREYEIKLDFLDPAVLYTARVYMDGKDAHFEQNPYPLDIREGKVGNQTTYTIKLAPGGGQAIWIQPAK